MELDAVAAKVVLDNIRAAVPSRWPEKVAELRVVADGDHSITLGRFLDEAGLELEDIYVGRNTFSDLRAQAGLSVHPSGPKEHALRAACGRLLHIDDFTRIETYRKLLTQSQPPDLNSLSPRGRALIRMLVASSIPSNPILMCLSPSTRATLVLRSSRPSASVRPPRLRPGKPVSTGPGMR